MATVTTIEKQRFGNERDLYHLQDATVCSCSFSGPEDGESALKECRHVQLEDCEFLLRYPLWHADGFSLRRCRMEDTCRAAIWYAKHGNIVESALKGIKCLRECEDVTLRDCTVVSPEFGWKCRNIALKNCTLEAEYCFLDSRELYIDGLSMRGKYSFQYVENMRIQNSKLNTKDAFWHAKNVIVEDSDVFGEYLGWYSENLTLVRCHIRGTQPLCYCKNVRLIDCTMENTDLSFEYSSVNATVKGSIVSVKNPLSGCITADSFGEIIREDSLYEQACVILKTDGTVL